jgi:hypothetical protein
MAHSRTTHPLSFYSLVYWSMLVEFRYDFLYGILKNYQSTLLDFKSTLRALHGLGWVWSGLSVPVGTKILILRWKGYTLTASKLIQVDPRFHVFQFVSSIYLSRYQTIFTTLRMAS